MHRQFRYIQGLQSSPTIDEDNAFWYQNIDATVTLAKTKVVSIEGANKVMLFVRGTTTTNGHGTFTVQVSPDNVSWFNYYKLLPNWTPRQMDAGYIREANGTAGGYPWVKDIRVGTTTSNGVYEGCLTYDLTGGDAFKYTRALIQGADDGSSACYFGIEEEY